MGDHNGGYMTCQSLNEWNSSYCNGVDWTKNMDRVATVLATEVKNNSFKMLKCIIEKLRESKIDGKYYIVKNPNAKEITIYCTEQEDSDDEEEDEAKAKEGPGSDESSSGSEESSSGTDDSSSDEDSSSEEESSSE